MDRTGDRGRYLAEGNLEFIGRTDHQVKIRGYRIELGEMEAALLRHEAVHACVVVVREEAERKQLVGYVVCRPAIEPALLRAYLQQSLPEYMIPGLWVSMPALPLTSNGKVDRQGLPTPQLS